MTISEPGQVRGYVRKLKDCVIELPAPADDLHRAVHTRVVDYSLPQITGNSARAMGMVPGFCADKPNFNSPWHNHDCEMQIGFVREGSVELGFVDGDLSRTGKGDVVMIPGGQPHVVDNASSDYVGTEFTFPGTFRTIDAKMPPAGTRSPCRKWGVSDAIRGEEMRGLIIYDYPVEAPYSARYALSRQRRSRVSPFVSGSLKHNDDFRLLYVTQGARMVIMDGVKSLMEEGDLLILPGGIECLDVEASDEHEALCMSLLRNAR